MDKLSFTESDLLLNLQPKVQSFSPDQTDFAVASFPFQTRYYKENKIYKRIQKINQVTWGFGVLGFWGLG